MRDPYEVLEAERGATPRELKSAYRRLARQWHPDRNADPSAESRFKEIASAWEILGDPDRRRRFDLQEGRISRGELPEVFLDDVADAIERAERWLRDGVLPSYARFWRGHGTEVAARLMVDLDTLVTPGRLRPASWWKRRKLRQVTDDIVITAIFERHPSASVVLYGRGLIEIAILPHALWDAGIREPGALDDAVMRLLVARYAQVLAKGRIRGASTPEEMLAEAQRVDGRQLRAVTGRRLAWGALAAILGGMFLAGYNQW